MDRSTDGHVLTVIMHCKMLLKIVYVQTSVCTCVCVVCVCFCVRDVPIIGSVTILADDILFFTISVIVTACTVSRYKYRL